MSIGPINEILVSITNIVRHTQSGQVLFHFTEQGEHNFDIWQKNLLDMAEIIHSEWLSNNTKVEDSLDIFERLFSTGVRSTYNKEIV